MASSRTFSFSLPRYTPPLPSWGVVALLPLVWSCSMLPTTKEVVGPSIEGRDVRLTLLHTSDIHSRLLPYEFDPSFTDNTLGLEDDMGPYGGVAKMAYILKRERQRASRVLLVDTGDVMQGAIIFNEFDGEAEAATLSEMGLQLSVLGNHEFDKGAENLAQQMLAYSTYELLAANYEFESSDELWATELQDIVQPSALYEVDGLQVGFVGLANLSSLYSIWDESNSQGVTPQYTGDVLPAEAAKLRAMGADIIVVLSHLGLDDDIEVAENFDDADVILGGHHHVALDPPLVVTNKHSGKRIPVVHSGAFSKFVGRLDLVVRDGALVSHAYTLFPIDRTVPDDPATMEILEKYSDVLEADYNLSQVLGYAEEELLRYGTTGGDSMLGNFTADAMRFYEGVETEIALTNTLGIRADISPGDITLDDVYNSFPFDNMITTMFLTGREVQELLDYVTYRSSDRGCNAQAQVSGIQFEMNCTTFKAQNIQINGAPLNLDGTYELATNDYIAAGGSGFDVLERNTTQQATTISIRDVVAAAFSSYGSLPQPGVCEEQGRIIPVTE